MQERRRGSDGGRDGGRDGEWNGGREGVREGGRDGEWNGGREGVREGGRVNPHTCTYRATDSRACLLTLIIHRCVDTSSAVIVLTVGLWDETVPSLHVY